MKTVYDEFYKRETCVIRGVCDDVRKHGGWYYVDIKTTDGENITLTIIPGLGCSAFAPGYWFRIRFFPNKTDKGYDYDHVTDEKLYYTKNDLLQGDNEIMFGRMDDERTFLDTEKNTVKYFLKRDKLKGRKPNVYNND